MNLQSTDISLDALPNFDEAPFLSHDMVKPIGSTFFNHSTVSSITRQLQVPRIPKTLGIMGRYRAAGG